MAQFPFVTDGIRGDVPNNFYPAADSDKGVILIGSPGLDELCDLTDCTEIRGLYGWGNYIYCVARRGAQSVFWRLDVAGGFSEISFFVTSASGPVWMTNNSTQLLIVDGVTGYVYTLSTGVFIQITDADFPGAAAAAYQDGYGLFVTPSSNQWFFSSLYDFTGFDSLDFYTKESKPDNIVSILSHLREPWIFGETSTEVWYNAGGDNSSAANPTFARNTGGVIEHGCGAAASPGDLSGDSVIWLSNRGQLLQAVGYNAQVISSQMFTRAVTGFASYSDAVAFSYKDGGHSFYQITFPTANETWVYDATTKMFHKKQSYLDGGGGYGRHRANCYTTLNGKHYVGDFSNGKVYEMSTEYYDDDGEEIRRVVYSQEIGNGMERISFPAVQVIVEPGVGLLAGADPQIGLEFSKDGCHTWSTEVQRGAGLIGDYSKRALWLQQGSGYIRTYRLTVTAPVLWRILGVDFGGKSG